MPVAIIFDIGATNIRTIAISEKGKILSIASRLNSVSDDPYYAGGKIWDIEQIWSKLKDCCREVVSSLSANDIVSVTVTTFGVDGAPVDLNGNLLYPVISWACERTIPVMEELKNSGFVKKAYSINGLQPMHYNTVSKILWLKQNRPDLFKKTYRWLLLPSIIIHRLTGEFVTDTSMAGTTMLTDQKRNFSKELLLECGIPEDFFPTLLEPGEKAGKINSQASKETFIPENVPVIVTGHDTQFAVFGAGGNESLPVLSSGTWEILFCRSKHFPSSEETLKAGVTSELDSKPGFFNSGIQWIASGIVEWMKNLFYREYKDSSDIYNIMIDEAKSVKNGASGVFIHPAFFPGVGPSSFYSTKGTILGLTISSTRKEILRSLFESLAFQTREALEILQRECKINPAGLICTGGGSKNSLWNRLRADITGIPLYVPEQTESTALGAAMFAFTGCGIYSSPEEARQHMTGYVKTIEPSTEKDLYEDNYQRFKKLGFILKDLY